MIEYLIMYDDIANAKRLVDIAIDLKKQQNASAGNIRIFRIKNWNRIAAFGTLLQQIDIS